MLEQADQSGRLDPDDFNEKDIAQVFGLAGVQMLIVDAIFANGDRHAGNFGFLRSSETGAYLGMAPLYDFDHALDSLRETDRLLEDTLAVVTQNEQYLQEAVRISQIIITHTENDVFRMRALYMKKQCGVP